MLKASSKKRVSAVAQKIDFGKIDPIISKAVEYLRPDQITVPPGNPRKHTPKNLEAIARAVVATGVMTPLIVNSRNELAAGEGRLGAAALLNLSTVPVLRAEASPKSSFLHSASPTTGSQSYHSLTITR